MPVEAVGAYLRELRERRGISLDEVSRQTRVPVRYLEALEASRLDDLPAPVFVRGFVRAYCQALREPPEHALARLDARGDVPPGTRTAPQVRRAPTPPADAAARSRARPAVVVSLALVIVLGVALLSVTMVVHPRDERRVAAMPDALEASEVEQALVSPAPAVEVGSVTASPPPAPAAAPAPPAAPAAVSPPATTAPRPPAVAVPPSGETARSAYRLIARATETTWIRVRTGEGRTIEETLAPGAVREWVSSRPFELTVGNAGGVLLELNGNALPPLGASGAVISRLIVPAEPR